MTTKLYLYPDAPIRAVARVLEIHEGPVARVVLDQTCFHVKGGGQLPDNGTIGLAKVTDVRHAADGSVDHFVTSIDTLTVGEEVELFVDERIRSFNSRLHTAGHLIAAVLNGQYPELRPVGAHHYPGESRVEFSGASIATEQLKSQLANMLAGAVDANLQIDVLGNPEQNRSIAIDGYPPIPCGGTHVRATGLLGAVEITGVKFKEGRLRVSYSCQP